MLSKRFKNLVSVILVIVFVVGLNSNIFGTEVEIGNEVVPLGGALLPEDYITIHLNDDNTATVTTNDGTFDIKYKKSMGRILIGNGIDNDLLKILFSAGKIAKKNYNLLIHQGYSTSKYGDQYISGNYYNVSIIETSIPNDMNTVINIYKNTLFMNTVDQLFSPSNMSIKKVLGFGDDWIYDGEQRYTPDESIPYPQMVFEDNKYEYYLPIRFLFEEFGFNVYWANEDKTITLEYLGD